MTTIQIREAVESDLPSLLDIYNAVVRTSPATFDLVEQSLEQRKKWFAKFNDQHPLIVADENGTVVGYASLSTFREKEAYRQTAESSVYIHEEHHGKGVGRLLMTNLLQRAKDLKFHTIVAGITGGNDASVQLHKKLGFQQVGVFREVGFKFGEYHDVAFYQLWLA
ncbi:GNAT family N-acetyltransferase [Brevibacillus sp. SYSU BS000544]|uniref:GNAT family N-acetyltransferase n=1 Tax=Brevibacillus sp. SYSU BS000544 TaxID=3416443 RepID=UPI003CE54455